MEEILLREVLSEKHNVRFDCCSAECTYGDVVVHYGPLQKQQKERHESVSLPRNAANYCIRLELRRALASSAGNAV